MVGRPFKISATVTTGLVPVVHAEARWIARTSRAMTADLKGVSVCFSVMPTTASAEASINIRLTRRRAKAALEKIKIAALVRLGHML